MNAHRVRLLVCGEPMRGDDGVALAAVRRLSPAAAALAEVRIVGQLGPEALLETSWDRPAIVVDALAGLPAGAVATLPLHDAGRLGPARAASTHALPPGQAVALAEALGADLRRSRLVGLGGADFRLGAHFSPAVRAALPAFVAVLEATIVELAVPSAAPAGVGAAPSPTPPAGGARSA